MEVARKRKILTNGEKIHVVKKIDGGIRPAEIAAEFCVSRNYVYKLYRNREKFQAPGNSTQCDFLLCDRHLSNSDICRFFK